jgi:6-methylsalicylate decarboxylase
VPVLQNRIAGLWKSNPKFAERIPKGPMHELQKLYYETAGATFGECLAPLTRLVTSGNILFGTDYPLGRITVAETLSELEGYGFSEADLGRIGRDNALRLFPQLQEVTPCPPGQRGHAAAPNEWR